jgi:N-acetylglucosaminyldiphosphoundecaprenol N-acetyl-beta-D-mannosaminyltransferase
MTSNKDTNANELSAPGITDDLDRNVYCILGIPLDAVEMPAVLRSIEVAAVNAKRFVISTANINFLANSQTDSEFRESLLLSDLCSADGMPVVWIARLLGIPIRQRIAGSDIFEALKMRPRSETPLSVFLFGATDDVASAAAKRINEESLSLRCVGWICPGFVNIDELSNKQFIDQINSSNAHFLMAALGASKGQLWIKRNHDSLRIPIRSHLGATINFQAGVVRRAPSTIQKIGLEWLWRIKEEPHLWQRYWHDGRILLRMFITRILPLAVELRLVPRRGRVNRDFAVEQDTSEDSLVLRISGYATVERVATAVPCFRAAVASQKPIIIDLVRTSHLDARFFGLLLMLRKQLASAGAALKFVGVTPALRRQFRLNGVEHLIS